MEDNADILTDEWNINYKYNIKTVEQQKLEDAQKVISEQLEKDVDYFAGMTGTLSMIMREEFKNQGVQIEFNDKIWKSIIQGSDKFIKALIIK
jgi:hypothetical protein